MQQTLQGVDRQPLNSSRPIVCTLFNVSTRVFVPATCEVITRAPRYSSYQVFCVFLAYIVMKWKGGMRLVDKKGTCTVKLRGIFICVAPIVPALYSINSKKMVCWSRTKNLISEGYGLFHTNFGTTAPEFTIFPEKFKLSFLWLFFSCGMPYHERAGSVL